jgi:ribosomal protein S6
MRAYEVMVILDPSTDERTVAPSLDKFLNVVRQDGGSVENVDVWGRRRLAYEVKKNAEPQISQAIYKNVNDALAGRTSPADAIKKASDQINSALSTF